MLNFLGSRLLQLVPTLFFVSILIFLAAAFAARRSGAGDGGRRARSGRHRADPQAIPPRSADPGAICLLGQGRAGRRFRRIAAGQGARARTDRAETAGDATARVDGDRDRVPDRHSCRNRLRGEERHGLGLWRQPVCAVGYFDAEFLARNHADLPVLDQARLASRLRLRAPLRELAREPCVHHHAGLRARQCHCRGPDAAYAQRHVAGARKRLCSHRARQRPVGAHA